MGKNRARWSAQAVELIARMSGGPPWRHAERAALCDELTALAQKMGAPLLAAQALLAHRRWCSPFADPTAVVRDMHLARQTFQAHGRSVDVARCDFERACASADLGHEVAAVQSLQAVLLETQLHTDDRLYAHLAIARCHLFIGDMDASLHQLQEHAIPLATGGAHPLLRSSARMQLGMVMMSRLIARQNASAWVTYSGLPGPTQGVRPLSEALACFDQAARLLPEGCPDGFLRLARWGGLALLGEESGMAEHLEQLRLEALDSNPALAIRVLFAQALLTVASGKPTYALGRLAVALDLCRTWGQAGLARIILQQQSTLHQQLGQSAQALEALQQHAHLVAISLRGLPSFDTPVLNARQQTAQAPAADDDLHSTAEEPLCVTQATRYVANHMGVRIRVGDLVAHCGISRRTLENAFRQHRLTSVSEFIHVQQMAHAAQALRHTRLSIQVVAKGAGYRSPSGFAREFKARFGMLPSLWRQRFDLAEAS